MTAKSDSSGARRAFRAFVYDVEGIAHQTMSTGMRLAEAVAKSTTTFKDSPNTSTVHTRETIRGLASGTSGRLIAGGAARFLENGTRAHMIWAKRALQGTGRSKGTANEGRGARSLRFVVNGQVRFARYVFHPGTTATHFLKDAAAEALLWMVDTLHDQLALAARRRGLG